MKKTLIIKTGSTHPALAARKGDFQDWIIAGLGLPRDRIAVVDVTAGEALPAPDAVDGVVITGSHAMVTDHAAWNERTADWLRDVVTHPAPVLGICYGHQLLAYALGGAVDDNPRGFEIGTMDVRLDPEARADPLLRDLPDPVRVHLSHRQSVLALPPGARRLAWNDADAYQAFVYGDHVWGLQFHPEFDADVVRAYIAHNRGHLLSEGQDPERLLAAGEDTPYGETILRRFAHLIGAAS